MTKFTVWFKPKYGYLEVYKRNVTKPVAIKLCTKLRKKYEVDDLWFEETGDTEKYMKSIDPNNEEEF